jgi:hypothetical protein
MKICTLLLVAMLPLSGFSQSRSHSPSVVNSLRLEYGPGYYARQDQVFSPFVHTDGSAINTRISWQRNARLQQFTELEFGSYNPILVPSYTYDTDKQTYPHSFLLVNLTYGIGKDVATIGGSHTLTLGGFFESDVQASTYNYARNGSFGYFASFSLGGWANYSYRINDKHTVGAKVLLPLVSLVARSPYLVNDDEFIINTYSHNGVKTFFAYMGDGKVQTLNKVQQVELNLNYQYKLNDRWSLGAAYAFRFIHSADPLNLTSYRNTVYLSGTYTF